MLKKPPARAAQVTVSFFLETETTDRARIFGRTDRPTVKFSRTYLYGPAVCCKPDVSDGGIGLALLYPARE
jgi:hypothetical protein